MRRLYPLLLPAVITAALGAAAVAQAEVEEPKDQNRTISGRVITNTGKPIAGAKVFIEVISSEKWQQIVLYTDKKGNFKKDLKFQSYRIGATADRYSYSDDSYAERNGDVTEFRLWPEYKVSGKVVDENGQPLEGVFVTPSYCQGSSYSSGTLVRGGFSIPARGMHVVTGKDGSFVIRHLPSPDAFESYSLLLGASKKGRAMIRLHCSQQSLSQASRIVMPLECVIEGKVKLPDASAEPTAALLLHENPSGADGQFFSIEADGSFRIGVLAPGKYSIQLYPRGLSANSKPPAWTLPVAEVELQPAEVKSIELNAVKGAVVRGVVTNASTGKPLLNSRLSVAHAGVKPPYGDGAVTPGDDGKFEVRWFPVRSRSACSAQTRDTMSRNQPRVLS